MEVELSESVFQTDSNIVRAYYKKDNYKIEYNDNHKDNMLCVLYFCSNDIYYPNTEEAFRKKIIEKDFYEWYRTKVLNAYKHIFVRDIQKQWYIEGINERINSPELLLEFLKKETFGYSVITLGSSAGGYAAVLYGSLLSAKIVLSFNGQFEVNTLLNTSSPEIDPLLFRNRKSNLSIYYDLTNSINKQINIYYFVSYNSDWDNQQYSHIKDIKSIKPIFFKTKHHGIPFVKSALSTIINFNKHELDSLTNKRFNSVFFSFKYGGYINTIKILFNAMFSKVMKIVKNK